MNVPQREEWTGEAARLGEAWRLRKYAGGPPKTAVCALFSHQFGWELRLEINGALYASQVCRNGEQVLTTAEQWEKAMKAKGWQ